MDDVNDLLLHLRGLVYVRALLDERGATPEELAQYDAEIQRVRRELAAVTLAYAA